MVVLLRTIILNFENLMLTQNLNSFEIVYLIPIATGSKTNFMILDVLCDQYTCSITFIFFRIRRCYFVSRQKTQQQSNQSENKNLFVLRVYIKTRFFYYMFSSSKRSSRCLIQIKAHIHRFINQIYGTYHSDDQFVHYTVNTPTTGKTIFQ